MTAAAGASLAVRIGSSYDSSVGVERDTVFFDGDCALCHATVRMTVRRDRAARFAFGPLSGATFARVRDELGLRAIPDSVIVVRANGAGILFRSDAALYLFEAVGGAPRVFARVARLAPRALRDFVYDAIARARKRLSKPSSACPVPEGPLRARFVD